MNPSIDILLCCGGLTWFFGFLFLIWPNLANPQNLFFQWVTIGSLTLLSMPHGIASYLRVFDNVTTRQKLGMPVAILAIICAFLCAGAIASPAMLSLVGRLTWGFSCQHFYAQSYGIALLYCYKRGFLFTNWEKRIFYWLIQSAIWDAIIGVFSGPEIKIASIVLEKGSLPVWTTCWSRFAFFSLATIFVCLMVRRWIRTKELMPLPAVLTLTTTFIFLGGYFPRSVHPLYLAAMMGPNLHLTQYLVITTAVRIKEVGLPDDVPFSKISTQLYRLPAISYLLFLLGAGWLTSVVLIPLIWKLGGQLGFNISMVVAGVFCFINLHHYLTDSLLWKQKDPYTLKLLIS